MRIYVRWSDWRPTDGSADFSAKSRKLNKPEMKLASASCGSRSAAGRKCLIHRHKNRPQAIPRMSSNTHAAGAGQDQAEGGKFFEPLDQRATKRLPARWEERQSE